MVVSCKKKNKNTRLGVSRVSVVVSVCLVVVLGVGFWWEVGMLEEQPVLFRKSPSRRRMLRPGVGTDDRGWTFLHICARKGDLKLVSEFNFMSPLLCSVLCLMFFVDAKFCV